METTMMGPAEKELGRALMALRLEVVKTIADDVRAKADAALDEARTNAEKKQLAAISALQVSQGYDESEVESTLGPYIEQGVEHLKELLAEAREAGLQEGMQAFTAEAAESVEVARREAWHDLSAEEWNELYPVGVPVRYWPVLGDDLYRDTITRGQAWTLGDGHSIVTIQGQPGGVSLRHLAVRLKGEEH